jgi:hypothetical protein
MSDKTIEIRSGLERIEVRFEGKTTQIVVASAGAGRVSIDLDYRQLEDLVLALMSSDPKGMRGPRAMMALKDIKEGREPVGKITSRKPPPRLVVNNPRPRDRSHLRLVH